MVNLFYKIANYWSDNDTKKALLYASQELELSQQIKWVKGEVKSYNTLGNIYLQVDKYDKALINFKKGYELAKANKLPYLENESLSKKGLANFALKNYKDALPDLQSAFEYFQQSRDVESTTRGLQPSWSSPAYMVGVIYIRQKKDSVALHFYQQILDKYVQAKDTLSIKSALRMFITYYASFKHDYSIALKYNFKWLSYYRKGDTSYGHAEALTSAADNYVNQKDYVKALEYYRQAIGLKPGGDPKIGSLANRSMSSVYKVLGDYSNALDLDLAQLKDSLHLPYYTRIGDYQDIAADYTALGKYEEAFYNLNKALLLSSMMEDSSFKATILGSLADLHYRTHHYDDAMRTIKEGLSMSKANEAVMHENYISLGIILRDAPDAVLQKYGISPAERYSQALKYLLLALEYLKQHSYKDYLRDCYKELSETYKLAKDYKGFYDTYPQYIALRDSSINLGNQHAFLNRLSQLQFEKKEDSLKAQQLFTEQQLRQQTLLAMQRQQALQLNQQNLKILHNENELQELSFQKTRSDLLAEQNKRRANEQQLKATQKEQALQKAELRSKRTQSFYYIAGITALLALSFFILRNSYNQRKSNRLLTVANTQINIEKQRSESLLLNILPADVAEELKEKGSAGARLFDDVTVLFTDFVNFTTISELLTPQELVDELHYCFKAFDEITGRYGIEKIKTIGDAYLAVAGLPNADVQHASNTVKAALEVRQFIHARKEKMGNRSFDIRIGIHSGSVVAGIVGVRKFAYDIWGDTVNTAARMEQHSLPGHVNLSEKTYEMVKNQFAFTYRGEIEAKNKGALKMYFVEKLYVRIPVIT